MSRSAWVVLRREMGRHAHRPATFVLAMIFAGTSLFLGFDRLSGSDTASLRALFGWIPVLLAVFIPAITTGSLPGGAPAPTSERPSAHGASEVDLALGTFGGCYLVTLVALASTLPLGLGVLWFSEADPGMLVAQYTAAVLLAAQFVAVGIWASGVSRRRVTGFMVGVSLSVALVVMATPPMARALPSGMAVVATHASAQVHFDDIARGAVSLHDVLYFLSTAAVFLTLAVAGLLGRRPGGDDRRRSGLRVGTGIVIASLLVLHLLGIRVPVRLDLTRERLFTLADGTREVLHGLDDVVRVRLVVSRDLPDDVGRAARDVRELLAAVVAASEGRVRVEEVDPVGDTVEIARALTLGIEPLAFDVSGEGQAGVRGGFFGMAVSYADARRVMPVIERTSDLEYRLAAAIAGMMVERKPRVSFETGSGGLRAEGIPDLSRTFVDRYALDTVDLGGDSARASAVLDSTQVLVVAGATKTLEPWAVDRIRSFLEAGGAALLLLEPVAFQEGSAVPIPVNTGLGSLLEGYGVHFNPDLLFDLVSNEGLVLGTERGSDIVVPYPLWPVTSPTGVSSVIRNMGALTLGWAGSLDITDPTRATPLLKTTGAAGVRDRHLPITPDQDWHAAPQQLGERVVAVAVHTDAGRMVVVSDASFADGRFAPSNPQALIFVANAVDWLTQDEALTRIGSRDPATAYAISPSGPARAAWKWGSLVGVPLLIGLIGLIGPAGAGRLGRRRSRWREDPV